MISKTRAPQSSLIILDLISTIKTVHFARIRQIDMIIIFLVDDNNNAESLNGLLSQ